MDVNRQTTSEAGSNEAGDGQGKIEWILRSDNIATCRETPEFEVIDGYVAVSGDRICRVESGGIPEEYLKGDVHILDARGKTVVPGLIDAHTHLIHAGSREKELSLKLKGVPYLDILKAGGGILSTVKSTRAAGKDELKAKASRSLDVMLTHGTTTVEAKSGYGLDLETEVKCLEAAGELNREHPVDIISTYMGAHAVPEEFRGNPAGYLRLMLETVLPYVAEHKLAEFMDVFCEEGVFSPDECRILMKEAKRLGFKLKIHADEIVPLQGAELAAELGAVSAEHLLAASRPGIAAMGAAGVTAVLLPGTAFCLAGGRYADVRAMQDSGLRVALATDYNPGSCPTENLQTVMTFACHGMRLSPEDILKGMTIHGAHAVDRASEIGSIEAGKKADMVVFNAPNLEYVMYHFGVNHVDQVVKAGKIVVDKGIRI